MFVNTKDNNQSTIQLKRSSSGRNLICLPHAGGHSAAFRPLSQLLRANWGVVAVDPPGHGINPGPFIENIEDMVNLFATTLESFFTTPFVLYGHSLGGLIVYLLAQRLEQQGKKPHAVIVSGATPPDVQRRIVSDLPDQEFLNYITSLGGLPQEFTLHQDLIDFYMPIMRADCKVAESFVLQESGPLRTPAYIFSGDTDYVASPQNAARWTHFMSDVSFFTFHGTHMFPIQNPNEVAHIIDYILNDRLNINDSL